MGQKIITIGAGILGASAAYQLQKAGAEVTVIDAGHANATQSSFGWINASFFENADHFHLRAEAIKAYHTLAAELPIPINWSGCLSWEETGAAFDAQRDDLTALGYETREIDAQEFTRLEPHIANPPARCLHFPQEAAVESGALAQTLLAGATELGAKVISGVPVTGFIEAKGAIKGVQTPMGEITADQVLVTAGTATQSLLEPLGIPIPMLTRPALMLQTQCLPPIFNHVLVSELGELRQLPNGALLMPAAIKHQADTSDSLPAAPDQVADDALARLQAMLPTIPLRWTHATIAYRPVPQDGLPITGPAAPDLYIATMHSGITLGALMGQLIAEEMTSGPTTQTLAPYRPERFVEV